jgi:hypothetical protein
MCWTLYLISGTTKYDVLISSEKRGLVSTLTAGRDPAVRCFLARGAVPNAPSSGRHRLLKAYQTPFQNTEEAEQVVRSFSPTFLSGKVSAKVFRLFCVLEGAASSRGR